MGMETDIFGSCYFFSFFFKEWPFSSIATFYISHLTLHLSTLHDGNILVGLVPGSPRILDHAHHVHAANDLAKHDMLVVEKGRRHGGDEKLAPICIWA